MSDAPNENDYKELYEKLLAEDTTKRLLALERKVSDDRYAIKLVEKIVFTAVGLALIAIVGAVINLVVNR